jgi:hypothetical protein
LPLIAKTHEFGQCDMEGLGQGCKGDQGRVAASSWWSRRIRICAS